PRPERPRPVRLHRLAARRGRRAPAGRRGAGRAVDALSRRYDSGVRTPAPDAAPSPALASLPHTRRAILVALKERGEARADELAEALGITVSAVRQHLQTLTAAELVAHREQRGTPGRPKHAYHLSEAGEALFPRAYGALANELLDYLDAGDVERLFDQ